MFKIKELTFYNNSNEFYKYEFSQGINYFKGNNNSGKTVFYNLLDYMLGSSKEINKEEWYQNIKEISLIISIDNIDYILTRTKDKDVNYFTVGTKNFESRYPIKYREYKLKLETIFTPQNALLDEIKVFTGEELTFRTFTMFNFLGEKRQGEIQDFLDKCSNIEYIVKLPSLLNFIFNKNLKKIFKLEEQLNQLEKEIKKLVTNKNQYDFICKEINNNILILGLNIQYDGKNIDLVKKRLDEFKLMNTPEENKSAGKNLSELTLMLENINEQIKAYQNYKQEVKNIAKENKNRKELLKTLNSIISHNDQFNYLLLPIQKLISELDTTISFSQNSINDNTLDALIKQRELLKIEIKKNDAKFKLYSVKEKEKAIILLENYLAQNIVNSNTELEEKQKLVKNIKEELKELKNKDDQNKINELSKYITNLYNSAKDVSDFVKIDTDKLNFLIRYLKKGNILQPTITEIQDNAEKGTKELVVNNYYTGSMARHTLIQICGYFGFLKLLLSSKEYPIIPIFVGDHLSKSYDDDNVIALGEVLNNAANDIGRDKIQVFLFDDKDYLKLGLKPDYSENLIIYDKEGKMIKSGFIPFYKPSKKKNA